MSSSPKNESFTNNNNNDSPSPNTDKLSPDENLFINPTDGLSSQHPTLPELNSDDESNPVDPDSFDDLPTSIIVTNIHSEVFIDNELKLKMESLFREFCENCTFQWLKSFRRLRVNFDDAVSAANARIKLHQYEFNQKSIITCYFAQPVTPVSHRNLQPPAPVKQFLISPPASPPAGWEPRDENEPLVNHDLLAALANLTPGESHELHPQTEDQPGIIVHTALLPGGAGVAVPGAAAVAAVDVGQNRTKQIGHTKCPERA